MSDEQPTLDPTRDGDEPSGDNHHHGDESTPFIPPKDSPARMPKQIGKFRIKKLIATGGMGAIYQGMQEQPRRTVAIKLMKSGVTSKSALRRFEYESQLLARLRHPGIAEVYDAGTHEAHDGAVPYFVMEYITGAKRITEYVRDKGLSTHERLELFLEVARAVHHGHTKGIIHRDLKPDNILVDSHGRVKVIDFGVARATDSDLAVTTLQTDIGQLIGTVQYMSPEQVEAEPDDLDTRSDVYSLGVVLYETLCGKLPYDVSKMKVYDATRVVREKEAMKLSTIDSALRGDVETIVAKSLEKDRDRRYQSALELAKDIEHYLRDEPISARPPSLTYQVRVFARRNKGVVTGVAAVFGALLLGLAGMSYLYVDTNRARNAEAAQREIADREKEAALEARQQADQAKDEAEAATRRVSEQRDTINRNLYFAQMNLAGQAAGLPSGLRRVEQLTGAWVPKPGEEDLRGWEWYYLRSLLRHDNVLTQSPDHKFHEVEFSPDGRYLATDGPGFSITISDAVTGGVTRELFGHGGPIRSLKWSPDGRYVASSSGRVRVWDPSTGRAVNELNGHDGNVFALAWSPDSARLASGANDVLIKIWDVGSGRELETYQHPRHFGGIAALGWNRDGSRFASASYNGAVVVWDATPRGLEPRTVFNFVENPIYLAWAPDGTRLAVTGYGGDVKIWDVEAGAPSGSEQGPPPPGVLAPKVHSGAACRSLAWSEDGRRIATGGSDNAVTMLDARTGEKIQAFIGHTDHVYDIAWSPDGSRIVSASEDRTVRVWDPQRDPARDTLRGHTDRLWDMDWNPDGRRLASSSRDGSVRVWDLDTRRTIAVLPISDRSRGIRVTWNHDGSRLATSTRNSGLQVWELDTNNRATPRLMRGSVNDDGAATFAWSPDGLRIASGLSTSEIGVWDPGTGELVKTYTVEAAPGEDTPYTGNIYWSPDGKYLTNCARESRYMSLIEVATGEVTRWESGHEAYIIDMAWRPGSHVLASGSYDQTVILWDAPAGKILHKLVGHTNLIGKLAWNADADRLVSVSLDQSVKLWDARSGMEVFSMSLDAGRNGTLAWSPDGKRLATTAPGDQTSIRIWDVRLGYDEEAKRQASQTGGEVSR
ncbi:MAG: WD40 domain-containing protein [Planctomycetota bacterium]|jgi:WD40 repeat protein/tRNA A-37 threonylcarbamoyl transferase component Bud32